MSYKANVVKKPWGYEYLAYENDQVALWFLHIKNGQSTSMHCHPKKTTGLALLDGKVEVSFLNDKFPLDPLKKIMIRKGLFHSTKSIHKDGSCVFEIETPVDKYDLVRLRDSYGREGKPYEDSSFEYPKENDCLWIEDPTDSTPNVYSVGKTKLVVSKVNDISFFKTLNEERNVIFLSGGIQAEYGINVAGAGDIVSVRIIRELTEVFSKVDNNTIVMVMERG